VKYASTLAITVLLLIVAYLVVQSFDQTSDQHFLDFAPEIERRVIPTPVTQAPKVMKRAKPVILASTPKKIIKKVSSKVSKGGENLFKFLCQGFMREYLSDQDMMIDPGSSHYQNLSQMRRMLNKIKNNYRRLSSKLKEVESSDVCAADELEKYLTTLMGALKRKEVSREEKRPFILSMFNISTLQFNQGNESFALYIMFKLIEHKLISQEFMTEVTRLQNDHNIFMEMKYAKDGKRHALSERGRLKVDIHALTLLMTRTLY
jgi:hypothetical protein